MKCPHLNPTEKCPTCRARARAATFVVRKRAVPDALTALQVVRILETGLGNHSGVYADDRVVEKERTWIESRSRALASKLGFTVASERARTEWFENWRKG